MKFTRESLKNPYVSQYVQGGETILPQLGTYLLKLVCQNVEDEEGWIRTLEWLGEENKPCSAPFYSFFVTAVLKEFGCPLKTKIKILN